MTIVRSGVFALDDVVFSYSGLSEVPQVLQSSRGNTSGASPYVRTVSYAYDTQPVSGGNYSRLQTLTYPDGATQGFNYGASSSTPDSRISRATQLDLGSTALVGYGYVGMGTVAVTDYKVPGIQLDRYRAPSGASTVGNYSGLDKFGRVLRQMWVDTGFTTGSGGNPDRPPVVSTLYAYTKSSDRTQAVDDRPGAAQPLSQGYDYDRLHRLVEAKRGAWTGTAVPTGAGSQRWHDDTGAVTLDALGNWRFSWTDLDGSGSYSDATERDDRTHDIFNRIVGHVLKGQGSGGSDLNLGDLSYDRASNLASWKLQSGTSATAVTAKHDAWNRLTEVSFGGTLRCRQAHNALHWRSFQLSDRTGTGSGAGAGPDGTMDQARLMSYGADWRLLEERVDDNLSLSAWTEGTWSPSTDLDRVQQYVWGTRYVDDIVLHRVDRNMDGDYLDPGDGTWHHLTDAQFSSVCLVTDAGIVSERVAYSAYGTARQLWREDINADGAVDSADLALLLAAFGSGVGGTQYRSEIDLNRDGVINIMDLGLLLGGYAPALAPGTLSSVLVDNPIGWDGYVFDRESGLYTVRFRTYETGLGRWIERDPAGYIDGPSLLLYSRGSGIGTLDPSGLRDGLTKTEIKEILYDYRQSKSAAAPDRTCCGERPRLRLVLHKDTSWMDDTFCVVDGCGLSIDDIDQRIAESLRYPHHCCIRELIIDAHQGIAGQVSFVAPDAPFFDFLNAGNATIDLLDFDIQRIPVAARTDAIRAHQRVIDGIRRIVGRVCENGVVKFVQCDSGRGRRGDALGRYLARFVGRGITVQLYSDQVTYLFFNPLPYFWKGGRRRDFVCN